MSSIISNQTSEYESSAAANSNPWPTQDVQTGHYSEYDREWATFIASHSLIGGHVEGAAGEPELLPRVWNAPHH